MSRISLSLVCLSLLVPACASGSGPRGRGGPVHDAGAAAGDAATPAVDAGPVTTHTGREGDAGTPRVDVDAGGPPPTRDAGPPFTCAPPDCDMVSVPAGAYTIGCAAADPGCNVDAQPAHTVTLSPFLVDRTEVTQSAYEQCVTAGACYRPSCAYDPATLGRTPVRCVPESQAEAYCAWAGKRLPTEAEWEAAARGTDGRVYPWGDQPPSCSRAVIYCDTWMSAPRPVGSTPDGDSPFGAEDMGGNVAEWVTDFYDPGFYARSPASDPVGPTSGAQRVARGGAWQLGVDPSAYRRWPVAVDAAGNDVGFRCVR